MEATASWVLGLPVAVVGKGRPSSDNRNGRQPTTQDAVVTEVKGAGNA